MHFVPLRRRVVVAATLAALAGLSAGALYLRPSSAETKPAAAEPRPTPVPVATVVQSDVAMWDEFSGRLEAVERVDLRSRVAGAGVRPRRQARDHRRQPGRRWAGRSGADHPGLGQPDLRELRRR